MLCKVRAWPGSFPSFSASWSSAQTQAALIADAESDEKALEEATICSDPEEVADKIRQHHEALGIAYFMGSFNRGAIPHDRIVRSMRLFGGKVMPRFA